ncbi:MAG: hypothetical protein GWN58_26765 [Anaerolineae bacterium]|nr:hypothetical protein [Anaerolineae bacterium]
MLEASERWGVPPWELEANAPDIWMERRALWVDAKAERWSKPRPAVGEVRQVGNKRKKRLI